MAGYSDTPLLRKLGLKPEHLVYLDVDAAAAVPVDLEALGLDDPAYRRRLPPSFDATLLFCADRARLERRLPLVVARTTTAGMVWVCWPKKAAKVPTDLDDNVVREAGLAAGLVDVKVAAVDGTWSGLKLVRRLRDRS
jgi:hypothetical protein